MGQEREGSFYFCHHHHHHQYHCIELMLLVFFMITMISVTWLASWLVKIRGGFGGGGDVCGELLLSSFTFFAEAQLSTEGWFVLVSSSPSP